MLRKKLSNFLQKTSGCLGTKQNKRTEIEEQREQLFENHQRLCNTAKRKANATESVEKYEKKLKRQRDYEARRKASETQEQYQRRLEHRRAYVAARKAAETPEQHQQRLQRQRMHEANRRAKETPEQHERRIKRQRAYDAAKRLTQDPQERRQLQELLLRFPQGNLCKQKNSLLKKLKTTTVLSESDALLQRTAPPKLQKRQFDESPSLENRIQTRQIAAVQSTQTTAPPIEVTSEKKERKKNVQQHIEIPVLHQIPTQPAPRHSQTQTVCITKPKLIQKPQPSQKPKLVVANHQLCVMSNLASLWKNRKLCDASISNGISTIKVHKVVLSAVCPKLLSTFRMDILSQTFLQVNFPEEVSTEALNAFAEYMYNGILDLDPDILEQLKIIAKRLDMKEFEQLCDSHLPNHIHQPDAAATASFANFPMIQRTRAIPSMISSLDSTISTSVPSAPSLTTQVIDVKQEISDAELYQVQQNTVAVLGQESEVVSLAPKKSGNAAGFVICPNIKTELVGPENDRYNPVNYSSRNQVLTSTTSSSLSSLTTATAASSAFVSSIPASSTEFTLPFSQSTNTKFTKLKSTHSYESPIVSDLSPVSCLAETVCPQSNVMKEDQSRPLNRGQFISTSSIEGPSTSSGQEGIYQLGLYTTVGDIPPLLTTETVDIKNIDLYKIDLT